MTPRVFELLAIAFYLIPIAVMFVARAERDRPLSAIALDIPFAVALDLLGLFALCSVMKLDIAALVSRAVWITGGLIVFFGRRGAFARWKGFARAKIPSWPRAIATPEIVVGLGAAFLALAFSIPLSRHYLIHDRIWHGPLVTALGGQRLPFRNVLSHDLLRYHFDGDVFAAELRALGFDVISSHHALALAHDLLFALTAITTALLLRAFGLRRFWPTVIASVALLLSGPIPLRTGAGTSFMGFSYNIVLSLSFRPHVCLAALLVTGFIGAIAVRIRDDEREFPPSFAAELAIFALLAITDEPSAALLGTSLFIASVIASRTVRTFLGLAAFALGAAVTSFAFGGSLAPGGPVSAIAWVRQAFVPAIVGPSLQLSSSAGRSAFFFDVIPFAACAVGLLLGAFRARALQKPVLFALALTTLSLVLGTHVIVNHAQNETQRFFFAPVFCAPLLALLHLPRLERGSLARGAVIFGAFVPAIFAVYWFIQRAPEDLRFGQIGKQQWVDDVIDIDCRKLTGARIGEAPRLTYVESSLFIYFTGCRPIFAAGETIGAWPTRTVPIFDGHQLADLDRDPWLGDRPLDAICGVSEKTKDLVCSALRRNPESCRPEGTAFLRCPLSQSMRADFLHTPPSMRH